MIKGSLPNNSIFSGPQNTMGFEESLRTVSAVKEKNKKQGSVKVLGVLPLCLCCIYFDAVSCICVIAAYCEVPPSKEKILPPLHPHHLVNLCHWSHHSEGYSNKNKWKLIKQFQVPTLNCLFMQSILEPSIMACGSGPTTRLSIYKVSST